MHRGIPHLHSGMLEGFWDAFTSGYEFSFASMVKLETEFVTLSTPFKEACASALLGLYGRKNLQLLMSVY